MHLKKLEIYGFKSFAERTEIVFQQGATGIVGPNGSGKSNISDAVRWVLGEQSAKSLRGARMEDVIFNGTEKRKPLAWCEVSLVFENEDHALPVDFAEVMVTRRVYRNGESEYYLNKSTCRLRDMQELFRDTGIGKEGYSLIGQGRIDEILSVKSDDRRNVFEEAAGIVKYKARKVEAERRMENTRQNLTRVEDILDEMEKQLAPLREQSDTARRYLALRDTLRKLELNAFLIRYDRMQEKMTDVDATLLGLSGVLEEATRRAEKMQAERVAREAQAQQWEDAEACAHRQVLEATRSLEAQEGENNVLHERIRHAREDERRLENTLEKANQRMEQLEQLCSRHAEYVRVRAEDLTQGRMQLAQGEARLVQTQAETQSKEQALERHKAEIIEAMNRLSDMRSAQTRLTTMRQSLEKRMEESEAEEQTLCMQKETLQENLRLAEEAKRQVEQGIIQLTQETQRLEAQLREAAQQTEALTLTQQQQTARQHETTSRLRVLREMERDYEGYQHAVKQILLHAHEGGGVCGVVATLIKVPRTLERAMEMVLGAALQNVVTEDEHVAKAMIEYLRSQRFGRATFLPLTTVFGRTLSREERAVLTTPGCVGVASELIAFDPKYSGVVESLLGRTVVAKDLDAGIEIMRRGHHAFRLVTLEGDVMHSGGSMTGGSVQSRMTSLLSREREIEEHQAALVEIDKQLRGIQTRMDALETQRVAWKRERSALYAQTHQQEIAVAREQEHMQNAQAELLAHEKRLHDVSLMREQMHDNLEDIAAQLQKTDATQDHATVDQASLQQKIQQLQGDLMQRRAVLEALREETTRQKVAVAAQERELDAQQREWRRLTDERAILSGQQTQTREELEACANACREDEARCQRGQTACLAQRESLQQLAQALENAQRERQVVQEQLRMLHQSMEALHQETSEDTERHHRMELQRTKIEGDIKQLQERIWNEYELTYAGAQAYQTADFDLAEAEKCMEEMRKQIREMGTVNVNAVEDYRLMQERFEQLRAQRADLLRATEDLRGIIEELLVKMEGRFRQQFALLNGYFMETFVKLFGGGKAELKLQDEGDALSCDIEIVAQPPGKKLQLLTLLSGGERALTAIAILFAMLKLKPTPFCILDEIEAALDEANVANFADYLADYSRDTQFVVVTHRKGTMERCEALYGVAMEERGVSRMVSVKLSDAQTQRDLA